MSIRVSSWLDVSWCLSLCVFTLTIFELLNYWVFFSIYPRKLICFSGPVTNLQAKAAIKNLSAKSLCKTVSLKQSLQNSLCKTVSAKRSLQNGLYKMFLTTLQHRYQRLQRRETMETICRIYFDFSLLLSESVQVWS